MKIAIDAGHGPETPGKRTPPFSDGTFMHEYEFNSATARHVIDQLEQYEDVEILTTFEDSRDVPLQERTDKANAWKADVFLSIHANASGSGGWSDAHGIETYVYKSKPEEAVKLADCVQQHLLMGTGLYNRGVKAADFHVLRETNMTAILCECGFMTNQHEAKLLRSNDYRQKCAKAIADGIVEFYGLKLKQAGVPILSAPTATVGQAKAWARSKSATDEFINLADIYWNHADICGGVNPAVAYAQSYKETGGGHFGGVIDATYHNPCGLKTSSGGGNYDPDAHQRFAYWFQGVGAHLDHLALYAGAPGYPKSDTMDPRHFASICGVAKTVEALGGHWAPAADYGVSIVRDYLKPLEATPEPAHKDSDPVTWGDLRELGIVK